MNNVASDLEDLATATMTRRKISTNSVFIAIMAIMREYSTGDMAIHSGNKRK